MSSTMHSDMGPLSRTRGNKGESNRYAHFKHIVLLCSSLVLDMKPGVAGNICCAFSN